MPLAEFVLINARLANHAHGSARIIEFEFVLPTRNILVQVLECATQHTFVDRSTIDLSVKSMTSVPEINARNAAAVSASFLEVAVVETFWHTVTLSHSAISADQAVEALDGTACLAVAKHPDIGLAASILFGPLFDVGDLRSVFSFSLVVQDVRAELERYHIGRPNNIQDVEE